VRRWPRSTPRPGTAAPEPLLAAARALVGAGAAIDAPRLTADAWERIVATAEGERLVPLLAAVTRDCPLPSPVADRLRSAEVAAGRRHLLGVAQLRRLLAAFGSAEIPIMTLKGPALGESLYGDPTLRPFTDLDLLVHRADTTRAVALLSGLGYRFIAWDRTLEYELAHATAACFVRRDAGPGDFSVDLHWGLVSFPAGVTPHTIDAEEVWGRAVQTERWDLEVVELSREDLLLYLALHLAVHHPFVGCVWRLDIALLLRRHGDLDWASIVERASRWRVRGALFFALRVVADTLAVAAPAEVLTQLRPRGLRGGALERLARHREPTGPFEHLVDLLLLDAGADLLRALATSAAPTPSFVRGRYGMDSALRAYLAHYRRVGAIGLRAAHAAVRAMVARR